MCTSNREDLMSAKRVVLASIVLLGVLVLSLSCSREPAGEGGADDAETQAIAPLDSLGQKALLTYLREHFDDIHDVTMRYHHKDHTINGRVAIEMIWEGGRIKSAEPIANETGDEDLPGSMIEKMMSWKIEEIQGPAQIVLPFSVKIVGLDDPEFPNTAILTGEVTDAEGKPLKGALIVIKPEVAGVVHRAETNREGIFVRTLIPPGTYDLECSLLGYSTASKAGVELSAGEHGREKFVLDKK
jgi:hypothetical protein